MFDFLFYNPWTLVNRRGSVAAETTSVAVSDTAVTYSFRNRAFAGTGARGTLYVRFAQAAPDGTTTTRPIVFSCNGQTIAVTKAGGDALTLADIVSGGVYEFFFESQTNTIQVLSCLNSAAAASTTTQTTQGD